MLGRLQLSVIAALVIFMKLAIPACAQVLDRTEIRPADIVVGTIRNMICVRIINIIARSFPNAPIEVRSSSIDDKAITNPPTLPSFKEFGNSARVVQPVCGKFAVRAQDGHEPDPNRFGIMIGRHWSAWRDIAEEFGDAFSSVMGDLKEIRSLDWRQIHRRIELFESDASVLSGVSIAIQSPSADNFFVDSARPYEAIMSRVGATLREFDACLHENDIDVSKLVGVQSTLAACQK
jgi:hypothetical protein